MTHLYCNALSYSTSKEGVDGRWLIVMSCFFCFSELKGASQKQCQRLSK